MPSKRNQPSTLPRSVQSKITHFSTSGRKKTNLQQSPKKAWHSKNVFSALKEDEDGMSTNLQGNMEEEVDSQVVSRALGTIIDTVASPASNATEKIDNAKPWDMEPDPIDHNSLDTTSLKDFPPLLDNRSKKNTIAAASSSGEREDRDIVVNNDGNKKKAPLNEGCAHSLLVKQETVAPSTQTSRETMASSLNPITPTATSEKTHNPGTNLLLATQRLTTI